MALSLPVEAQLLMEGWGKILNQMSRQIMAERHLILGAPLPLKLLCMNLTAVSLQPLVRGGLLVQVILSAILISEVMAVMDLLLVPECTQRLMGRLQLLFCQLI